MPDMPSTADARFDSPVGVGQGVLGEEKALGC